MDPSEYENSKGRVEHTGGGQPYFIPAETPRSLEFTDQTLNLLEEAGHEMGRLSSFSDFLPNPHLLIQPYVRREAVLSSKIEGTQASLSEVFEEEAEGDVEPRGDPQTREKRDVQEVLNYVRALEYGIEELDDRRIDLSLMREMHRILMQGVRGEDKNPGDWREEIVWVGPVGTPIEESTYIPPAPEEMMGCLGDLEQFLRSPPSLPELIQIGLLHYQFEAIHPFQDGNGRIGRLLITLRLIERGKLPAPLLYLSAFFHDHRGDYYELLERVSKEGAYEEWLQFFLTGVKTQAADAASRARRMMNLREKFRRELQDMDATTPAIELVDQLFANPYITIPRAERLLNVAYPTAQRAVEDYLVEAGILEEVTGKQRNRRFLCRELLDALEEDTRIRPTG